MFAQEGIVVVQLEGRRFTRFLRTSADPLPEAPGALLLEVGVWVDGLPRGLLPSKGFKLQLH